MPTAFALHGASPNPFNPTTEISFDLPAAGDVQLTVYDVSGRRISTLVNGQMQAGRHSVRFSGDRLGSGTYFYELRGNGNREIGKMVLLK